MKVSNVGSTNAFLFEPENKKEEKRLNNYVDNKKFLETKTGKTNFGVVLGTFGASYIALMLSSFAKKKATKITSTVLGLAGLATSIGFCVKNSFDFKKFKNPVVEPQTEQTTEPKADTQEQPNFATQA